MGDAASAVMLALVALVMARGAVAGDAYAAFLRGAERGLRTAAEIAPAVCAMMLMLAVAEASGLMTLITAAASPVMGLLGLPPETAPVALLRPLTGSGSLAALEGIIRRCGVDSRAARAAAVMMGSSETILYTMTVYLAGSPVKRLPGVLPVSFAAWAASLAVCAAVV